MHVFAPLHSMAPCMNGSATCSINFIRTRMLRACRLGAVMRRGVQTSLIQCSGCEFYPFSGEMGEGSKRSVTLDRVEISGFVHLLDGHTHCGDTGIQGCYSPEL